MGYAEKRGDYYRARFKIAPGKYGTVKDDNGSTKRFRTKRDAEKAANDEEAKVRGKKWKDPAAGQVTFGEWVNRWYAGQDLADSTMANYKRRIEQHLQPTFAGAALADILPSDVDAWERAKREAGYASSSIRSWRTTLHTILADAVDPAGLIGFNPVTRKRGRGKRAGRSQNRAAEKVITDPLGALLIAERAAILSGRDDEFVMVTLKYYTGMRWGEITGLETRYARLGSIRVEWQLCEIDGGQIVRIPPKDDSYRDVDLPNWLSRMVSDHISQNALRSCDCHGYRYVFHGLHTGRRTGPAPVSISAVAREAGVSVGTVSNVLNRPERVAEHTRRKVEAAIGTTGFTPGRNPSGTGHWRRSSFASWIFTPAVSGRFPSKGPQKKHPVSLLIDPWPGRPVRGRGAQARAEICWAPIAPGLTPHGLKHSHKSLMVELRTPEVLSHERLGHEMGGIGAVYSHVTPAMRKELCEQLTACWEAALDARAAMNPRSPVAVLDELLKAREGASG